MSKEKAARKLVQASRRHGLSAIARAAKLLVAAHRTRRPAVIAGVRLESEADAYRVQEAVYDALWPETRAAAWKAGGPSDKVTPTAAPIPPERLLRSPASVSASSLNMVGIEAEVAYRLARDLPPRSRPYSDRSVAAAVGEVLVTIEVCDTRLADWKRAPQPWKLADFQNNGALVAGSGTADWQGIDFRKQEVTLAIGGREQAFRGAHPFGNPFRLLPWLVAHCLKRGAGLRAGDIVTTGSWSGLAMAQPGDVVVARFPGIGEAVVRIEP